MILILKYITHKNLITKKDNIQEINKLINKYEKTYGHFPNEKIKWMANLGEDA